MRDRHDKMGKIFSFSLQIETERKILRVEDTTEVQDATPKAENMPRRTADGKLDFSHMTYIPHVYMWEYLAQN